MEIINKIVRWFYTDVNGREYMTFWECSLQDKILVISTGALCLMVLSTYTMIAIDAYRKGIGYKNSATKKYLEYLMKTFILCAVTGYGYTILSIFINPYWLRVVLLGVLFYQAYKMYRHQKTNTSIQEAYEREMYLAEKYKSEVARKTTLLDLFKDRVKGVHNDITLITFDQLSQVPFESKFFSDESEVIENERINELQPGFTAKSVMKPNSYVDPHQHDTLKILTCISGKFHDSKTDRWYLPGTYLIIPSYDPLDRFKHWHDIKTAEEETELLTYILPEA